jgi:ABC-2 type transport system ATP-binding protein
MRLSGNDALLDAVGLVKSYRNVRALDGLDLQASRGSVLGLLGPNGAGKTTTVRILATLIRPDGGRARVAGHDVVEAPAAVRAVSALAGQFAAVDDFLTGRQNLEMVGRLAHLGAAGSRTRAADLLEAFDLQTAASRRVAEYSGGMRRRLDLAASLMMRPQLLFLDEPTSGLDPRGRLQLWDMIRTMAANGTTVLLTTQYLEEADQLADRIVVIDRGRTVASGTSEELKGLVGTDQLHLRTSDARRSVQLIARLGTASPRMQGETDEIVLPVKDAAAALPRIVRLLDGAGIDLLAASISQPTLDDVFLTVTGDARPPSDNRTTPPINAEALH